MIKDITVQDLHDLNEMASNFNLSITINDLYKENEYYIGYMNSSELIGFLNYSIYYERAELNYIFVKEKCRKNNIASEMLKYVLDKISLLDNITLEVRESNYAAIRLYEKYGFEKCAIRNNYYGKEDAILMIKKFGDSNGR